MCFPCSSCIVWLKKSSYDLIAFHNQLLASFALLQQKRLIANFSYCSNRLFYAVSPVLPGMTLQQAVTRQIFQKMEISLIIHPTARQVRIAILIEASVPRG
jgi:hypothetical protein